MVSGRPRVPRLTQITSLSQVSREALRSRMERATEPILVQVRDKELPREERRAFAAWVRDVARSLGHLVVINGDLALALELQLDGAHLPERRVQELAAARATLGPQRLLTAACHDLAGAAEAAALGADALLLSPIFASPGKGAPLGLAALARARDALAGQGGGTQLVALGGIDASNAGACLEAGADGVAVIRADLAGLSLSAEP